MTNSSIKKKKLINFLISNSLYLFLLICTLIFKLQRILTNISILTKLVSTLKTKQNYYIIYL